MPSSGFNFENIFGGETTPTTYDRYGDPHELSRETRVKSAADVFRGYHLGMESEQATDETKERIDIELDAFMRWIELTDEELEEAQQLATQTNQEEE